MGGREAAVGVYGKGAQRYPVFGFVACFFQEFTFCRAERIFARFDIPTDGRERVTFYCILRLLVQEKVALFPLNGNIDVVWRDDPGPFRDRRSVVEFDVVNFDLEEFAQVESCAAENVFSSFSCGAIVERRAEAWKQVSQTRKTRRHCRPQSKVADVLRSTENSSTVGKIGPPNSVRRRPWTSDSFC